MKLTKLIATTATATMAVVVLTAGAVAQHNMEKKGDTVVVNTTELGKQVKGYNGATPLKITIKKGKIVKVEALPNKETPRFFAQVSNRLLKRWQGMSTKKAAKETPDVITGATYSSRAVIENVKLGVRYYNENK